ncbi:MAG: hypothetical protein M3354_02455 [Chloroflexota bacterium]|nr:hypothetical protein [Chloroflexota bacterium]
MEESDQGRLDATDVLLVHAAPDVLEVTFRSDEGRPLAIGKGLKRTAKRPMARLTVRGDRLLGPDRGAPFSGHGRPLVA